MITYFFSFYDIPVNIVQKYSNLHHIPRCAKLYIYLNDKLSVKNPAGNQEKNMAMELAANNLPAPLQITLKIAVSVKSADNISHDVLNSQE